MAHTAATELRIERICEMMRTWTWKRGESAKALAAEWGVGVDWVEDLSAEASKRVRAEVTDPERVSETVGVALARVLQEGMEATDKERWFGRKLVVDSAKAWAQIVGAMAPQRHEVATTDATPAKAAALVRETFGRVTPKADVPASDDPADSAPKR